MIFKIRGIPRPWPKIETNRYGGSFKKDEKGYWKGFEQSLLTQLAIQIQEQKYIICSKDKSLAMEMVFFMPKPEKPEHDFPFAVDLSNLYYGVENTLKKYVYSDDRQIVMFLPCLKLYCLDNEEPQTWICLQGSNEPRRLLMEVLDVWGEGR